MTSISAISFETLEAIPAKDYVDCSLSVTKGADKSLAL
jgi:hypothetical protein